MGIGLNWVDIIKWSLLSIVTPFSVLSGFKGEKLGTTDNEISDSGIN